MALTILKNANLALSFSLELCVLVALMSLSLSPLQILERSVNSNLCANRANFPT